MRLVAQFAVLLAASACSVQPPTEAKPTPAPAAAAVHPVSGLRIIPVTVTAGKRRQVFQAEVAATEYEQMQGLMFRTTLGPHEAMIFPRNPPGSASFWMKNTPLPLDIIYVGTDRTVLNIQHGEPYSLSALASAGVTAAVLEIAGGRAAELGIVPGSRVDW